MEPVGCKTGRKKVAAIKFLADKWREKSSWLFESLIFSVYYKESKTFFGLVSCKTGRKKVAAIKFLADKWREKSR